MSTAQSLNSEDYVVTQFGLNEGLPQSSVNDIIQTKDGYIWLATYGGLVRFDGNRFQTYNRSNTAGMKYDRVVSVFEDSNNNIWAASEQGVVRLTKGKATSYSIDKRTSSTSAGWIHEDKEGRIWGSLNENFYLLKNNQFERQILLQADEKKLQKISRDTTGTLLFTDRIIAKSYKDTLYKVLGLNEKIESRVINLIKNPKKPGAFFIGTSNDGILKLEDNKVTLLGKNLGLISKDLVGFYKDRKERLWVYSYEGALINDGSQFQPFRINKDDQDLDFQIRSMLEDNEGNLWFGSVAKGLFRFKDTKISMIDVNDGLTNQRMLSLTKLNDGNLVFGTNCGGFFTSKNGIVEFPAINEYLPNNCIWSVFQDSKDRIWFSANGLYMTNSLEEKGKNFNLNDGFEGNNIFAITEDKLGNIWIGCSNGIFKYNDESGFNTYKTEEGLNYSETRVFYEDTKGNIWAGTISGIYKITDNNIEQVELSHSKDYSNINDEPYIRAIYEDEEGIYWFGSYGNGIFRMEGEQIVNITSKNGLFDNIISHIVEDTHGNFWIGSNRGIFRVSKKDLNDFSKGINDKVLSYSYGTGDGMNSSETNGGFHPSTIQDASGNIYFPTVSGVAVVSTNSTLENDRVPIVYIERIRGNGFDYFQNNDIEMHYDDSFLEISYTGINFSNPEQVQFRYKLEGYNDNWVDVGNQNSAIYSKIPPGSYIFKVTAATSNGVWNSQGASVKIIVTPPFWHRAWFIGVVIGLLIGGGYLFYLVRTNRLREENERQRRFTEQLIESQENERRRIASELHDGLGQQILVIKNRVEIARQQMKDSPIISEQLDEIQYSAIRSIEDVRNISHGLRPVLLEKFGLKDALVELCEQMQQSTSIEWSFHIDEINEVIPKDKQINFFRIIQESINNILKHSKADEASVMIRYLDDNVTVVVVDNGIGFNTISDEINKGLGLLGMKERAENLGGEIRIESIPSVETIVKINIPVTK
ncbi:MAG: hypothetical protein JXR20_04945 [Balneola sp.]